MSIKLVNPNQAKDLEVQIEDGNIITVPNLDVFFMVKTLSNFLNHKHQDKAPCESEYLSYDKDNKQWIIRLETFSQLLNLKKDCCIVLYNDQLQITLR